MARAAHFDWDGHWPLGPRCLGFPGPSWLVLGTKRSRPNAEPPPCSRIYPSKEAKHLPRVAKGLGPQTGTPGPALGEQTVRVLCQKTRAQREGNTGLWVGTRALGPRDAERPQLGKAGDGLTGRRGGQISRGTSILWDTV